MVDFMTRQTESRFPLLHESSWRIKRAKNDMAPSRCGLSFASCGFGASATGGPPWRWKVWEIMGNPQISWFKNTSFHLWIYTCYIYICYIYIYTHLYIYIFCFTVSYQNSMLTFRPYVWTNPVVDIVYDWIMRTCTLEAWFFVLPNRFGVF